MEKDDEMKGEGNSYTTHFRLNDPRLGRWLSIDPDEKKFPWQSPYVSMDNNPTNLTDPLGNSTHTDRNGRVIAVYNDADFGVYKHNYVVHSETVYKRYNDGYFYQQMMSIQNVREKQ